MIHTSRQLKALVRNKSGGDNVKAMVLIRNYIMERFLERISLSQYSDKLILKGGLLVASMVGIDNRATMDIDTTVKNYNLSPEDAQKMVEEIIDIPIEDGIEFSIKSIEGIMDDAEYPGIRLKLEAMLDMMKTPLKIDISTDDVITPREINYADLKKAMIATCKKRKSYNLLMDTAKILEQIKYDTDLEKQWNIYQRKYEYAADYDWENVMKNIALLFSQTT